MKRIGLLIVMVVTSMFTFSCSDDDNNKNKEEEIVPVNQEKAEIIANMMEGAWSITDLIDDGFNRSGEFNDFTFVFLEDNRILATNGEVVNEGNWTIITYPNNEIEFRILFEAEDFMPLKGNWDIAESNGGRLKLRNGVQVDELVFVRN